MECPNCKTNLLVAATVPDEQKFSMRLESEGEMFSAMTIGGVIANMDELLKGVAEDVGFKAHVFIESVEVKPHEITIGFLITGVKESSALKTPGAGRGDSVRGDV